METFFTILALTAVIIKLLTQNMSWDWPSREQSFTTNTNRQHFDQEPFGKRPFADENRSADYLSDAQIQEYMTIIQQSFPKEPTVINLPYASKNDTGPENWSAEQMETYYGAFVQNMAEHLRISSPVKTMVISTMDKPAQYNFYEGIHLLQIKDTVQNHTQYRAYIAFSMTACYFNYNHINLSGPKTSDPHFPEVAAAYLGLGFYFLKPKPGINNEYSGVYRGAINRDSLLRCIIATAIIRQQDPKFIIAQFDPSEQLWAEKQLATYHQ